MVAPRAQDDFVVDVGHVHDVEAGVAKVVLQHPPHNVKGQVIAGMPNVGGVVHGGAWDGWERVCVWVGGGAKEAALERGGAASGPMHTLALRAGILSCCEARAAG